jgi:hypothetical protein
MSKKKRPNQLEQLAKHLCETEALRDQIAKSLREGLQGFIGMPNTAEIQQQATDKITAIFGEMIAAQQKELRAAEEGYKPGEQPKEIPAKHKFSIEVDENNIVRIHLDGKPIGCVQRLDFSADAATFIPQVSMKIIRFGEAEKYLAALKELPWLKLDVIELEQYCTSKEEPNG